MFLLFSTTSRSLAFLGSNKIDTPPFLSRASEWLGLAKRTQRDHERREKYESIRTLKPKQSTSSSTPEAVDAALEKMRVGEIYEVTFRMRSGEAPRGNLRWPRVVENGSSVKLPMCDRCGGSA